MNHDMPVFPYLVTDRYDNVWVIASNKALLVETPRKGGNKYHSTTWRDLTDIRREYGPLKRGDQRTNWSHLWHTQYLPPPVDTGLPS